MTELDVRTTLATGILNYKDENPSVRSFKFISDRTKVAESFIKRIAKRDDSVSLDAEKFLSVAKLVLPEDKRKIVVTYFYKRFFSENLEDLGIDSQRDRNCKVDNSLVPPTFDREIVQEDTLLVYSLACSDQGADLEEIKSMGDFHLTGLMKLVESGYVVKKEDRYHALKKDWAVGMKSMRKMIRIFADCYKAENFGKKRNFALCYSFEVSQDGIDLLQDKMREFVDSVRMIKETYPGERQIVCAGFFDTISNFCYKDKKPFTVDTKASLLKSFLLVLFLGVTGIRNSFASSDLFQINESRLICSQSPIFELYNCLPLQQIGINSRTLESPIIKEQLGRGEDSQRNLEKDFFKNQFQQEFDMSEFEKDQMFSLVLFSCGIESGNDECRKGTHLLGPDRLKKVDIDELLKEIKKGNTGRSKTGGSSGSGG